MFSISLSPGSSGLLMCHSVGRCTDVMDICICKNCGVNVDNFTVILSQDSCRAWLLMAVHSDWLLEKIFV